MDGCEDRWRSRTKVEACISSTNPSVDELRVHFKSLSEDDENINTFARWSSWALEGIRMKRCKGLIGHTKERRQRTNVTAYTGRCLVAVARRLVGKNTAWTRITYATERRLTK